MLPEFPLFLRETGLVHLGGLIFTNTSGVMTTSCLLFVKSHSKNKLLESSKNCVQMEYTILQLLWKVIGC